MQRVDKPWGYELIFAKTDAYVGKVIHIAAGHRLSLQYHERKVETLMVEAGEMDLELGSGETREVRRMGRREVAHIPAGLVHRMMAVTDVDVIEVSTTELDDVVRLE